MTNNSILIRKANKIIVPVTDKLVSSQTCTVSHVTTFSQNLQFLGYVLHPQLMEQLVRLPQVQFNALCVDVIAILKELRGVQRYKPMYPNFPIQVMDATDSDLYVNAMIHYFSAWVSDLTGKNIIWLPKYKKDQRLPLDEKIGLTVLQVGTEQDLRDIAVALTTSNTSISDTDKEDLQWLVKNGYMQVLPQTIPNKENLSFVAALFINTTDLSEYFKTATDVLRLITAMSAGDVSLAVNTKFRNFTRKERRSLLTLLENVGPDRLEDMSRWKDRWIRVGEKLHPGDYITRFPGSFFAFTELREDVHIETFNTKVEYAIRNGLVANALDLLVQRPGEFARRLDHLFRVCPSEAIIDYFQTVVSKISTPVLLQVHAHFKNRKNGNDFRVVFPKGNLAKVHAITTPVGKISSDFTQSIVNVCSRALHNRFRTLGPLGKVYVDPKLSTYLLPFSQRSASKSLRTLVRGSQIPFSDEKDTLRFFIWWHEKDTRVDLDLSALIYGDDWLLKEQIAYYNMRNEKLKVYHSGDITSAPKGACEFIDVDVKSVLASGGRYVTMMVNSFSGQDFADVKECSAGWMLRQKPQSGEIFDARTVSDKIDVTSASIQVMPLIIDCATRNVIWADASVSTKRGYANNVHNNRDAIALIGKAFTNITKPTVYDLMLLHAQARGNVVATAEEADTVFSTETGTQFELGKLASEFMQDAVKTLHVSA